VTDPRPQDSRRLWPDTPATGFPTRRRQVLGRAAAAGLLWGALAAHARAGQLPADVVVKTTGDVVVTTTGDRLHGAIKRLSEGRLSFDVKSTGIVSVKWDYVIELRSSKRFDVETAAGQHLLGTLEPAGAGKAILTWETGAYALDLSSIVSLVPIGDTFWNRIDGSINVGGSYTQSSGIAQISINSTTTVRRPAFEWRIYLDNYTTFSTEDPTTERVNGQLGYAWFLTRRWALAGLAQLERNPDLGFSVRANLIGSLERTLVRSNRGAVVVSAGLGSSREKPVDGDTETGVLGLLGFRQSYYIYDTPKTSLDTSFIANPILNQAGRWRLDANATISREIIRDFSVSFSVYEAFDSHPSSEAAERNDVGATLSIGFTY
jgi:hypothetical protein